MRLHLLLAPCAFLVACVSVDSDFDDYVSRTNGSRGVLPDTGVIDTGTPTDTGGDGGTIDVSTLSGTFLMSCLPTLAGGDASKSLLFYATVTGHGDTNAFDVVVHPIQRTATTFATSSTDSAQFSATAIPVAGDGSWSVSIPGLIDIPGDADRLLNGAEITIDHVELAGGHVMSSDLLCNDLHGTGESPIPNNDLGSGNFCVWKRLADGSPLPTFTVSTGTFVGYDVSEYHCP